MTRRLLGLSVPLALLLAVPAVQVVLDRAYLRGSCAVSTHAVLLCVATLLFTLLSGPNAYAVVAIPKLLKARGPADATVLIQNTVGVAVALFLFCLGLVPLAEPLSPSLLGHPLDPDECCFAKALPVVVSLLILQNGALAPTIARGHIWPAVGAVGVGLAVHATVLGFFPEGGLTTAALARAAGALVSSILAFACLDAPKRFGFIPRLRFDRAAVREIVSRGAVIGIHALVGSAFMAGFFLAVSRNGPDELAATAVAFGWYALVASFPLGLAQATGIVTAEAAGADDPPALRFANRRGDCLCYLASSVVAVGFFAVGHVLMPPRSEGTESLLANAVFGVCCFAAFDGTTQCRVWSLRALGRQNQVLIVTLALGVLYTVSLCLFTSTGSCWTALAFYGVGLAFTLERILVRTLPARSPAGE
jgi:hypothetical protein